MEISQLQSKQSLAEKEPTGRDLKEKRSLYKHNQRLEELRNLQEQLREDRQALEKERVNDNKRLELRESELDNLQVRLIRVLFDCNSLESNLKVSGVGILDSMPLSIVDLFYRQKN